MTLRNIAFLAVIGGVILIAFMSFRTMHRDDCDAARRALDFDKLRQCEDVVSSDERTQLLLEDTNEFLGRANALLGR